MKMREHIRPLRLFHLSQADTRRKPIEPELWEKEHLQHCEECQQVVKVLAAADQIGREGIERTLEKHRSNFEIKNSKSGR